MEIKQYFTDKFYLNYTIDPNCPDICCLQTISVSAIDGSINDYFYKVGDSLFVNGAPFISPINIELDDLAELVITNINMGNSEWFTIDTNYLSGFAEISATL